MYNVVEENEGDRGRKENRGKGRRLLLDGRELQIPTDSVPCPFMYTQERERLGEAIKHEGTVSAESYTRRACMID